MTFPQSQWHTHESRLRKVYKSWSTETTKYVACPCTDTIRQWMPNVARLYDGDEMMVVMDAQEDLPYDETEHDPAHNDNADPGR
jgi:hypothetical protein